MLYRSTTVTTAINMLSGQTLVLLIVEQKKRQKNGLHISDGCVGSAQNTESLQRTIKIYTIYTKKDF
jgi:hypothetical protein